METFQERVKQARESKGYTQDQVADLTGITKATISRYENGKRKDPARQELKKLAKCYDISVDWLIGVTDVKIPYGDISEIYAELSYKRKEQCLTYAKFLLKEQQDEANATQGRKVSTNSVPGERPGNREED